ncbi:MAG TPA: STAS domain-containing protein [Candidatus Baltobacteraceae bacterium]|jgi:anti-anti-sigma factor
MSHDELSINITTSHEGETVVFKLTGSLDLATSPSVRAALLEETGEGKKHDVVVDLTGLEFLDSTGLGALIGAQRRALEHNAEVRLVVADGPIARLLNITGLVRVFGVYPSLEAALAGRDKIVAPL